LKRLLTKLLLALLLVANPVAVLASDFHDVEMETHQADNNTENLPVEKVDTSGEQQLHEPVICEMNCCKISVCYGQSQCMMQLCTAAVTQMTIGYSPPMLYRAWGKATSVVPHRLIPPDHPPPIHI
jgi:hypothetical protein